MACPYNVRYLNDEERVVEKCTLCEQKISQGELPQCVAQCSGRARYFGDLDGDIRDFEGPSNHHTIEDATYESVDKGRIKLGDYVEEFAEGDVHRLTDVGNAPAFAYILRDRTWQGRE